MIATPPQSAEPLPEPEVVNGTQKGDFKANKQAAFSHY